MTPHATVVRSSSGGATTLKTTEHTHNDQV